MTTETGTIYVEQCGQFRRPVVKTPSGVYLLDSPYWMSRAGRMVTVKVNGPGEFAEVISDEQGDQPCD